jgi:transposase
VSRDRYNVFQQAIEEANPAIVQVSDRFHLTKNLWELLDKVLLKALPAKIRRTPLNDDGVIQAEPTERQLSISADEKKRVAKGQKKRALNGSKAPLSYLSSGSLCGSYQALCSPGENG